MKSLPSSGEGARGSSGGIVEALKYIYNPVQVMLCSYMAIDAAVLAYENGYTLLPCNTFNQLRPPLAKLLWVFYLSKVLDFCDTVFIILTKKWAQLSFLHVYHHASIFLVSDAPTDTHLAHH
jgi:elongation of very long chain fatty acids protein 4